MNIIRIVAEIVLCFLAVVGISAIGIEIMRFFAVKRFHGKIYSVITLNKEENVEHQLRDLFDSGMQRLENCEKVLIISDGLTEENVRICNIYVRNDGALKVIPKNEIEKYID